MKRCRALVLAGMAASVFLAPVQPVAAFTCPEYRNRRAEILDHFVAITNAEASYVVVLGTVSVTGPERQRDGIAFLPMRVRGRQLGASGFGRTVAYDFERRVVCDQLPGDLGDCSVGHADREDDVLLFLRRAGGRLVLDHRICGGTAFGQIDNQLRGAVEACHVRGICR
ncbi:MAG: hypothetical protein Kow0013_29700 [Pararhodobacter sp.]